MAHSHRHPLLQPRRSFSAVRRRSNKTLDVANIYLCLHLLSRPTYLVSHIYHGEQHNIHPPRMAAYQRTRDDMSTARHYHQYVSHLQHNLAYNIHHDILTLFLLPMGKDPTMAPKTHLSHRDPFRRPEVRILPSPIFFFPGFLRRLNYHLSLRTPRRRLLDREKSFKR